MHGAVGGENKSSLKLSRTLKIKRSLRQIASRQDPTLYFCVMVHPKPAIALVACSWVWEGREWDEFGGRDSKQ